MPAPRPPPYERRPWWTRTTAAPRLRASRDEGIDPRNVIDRREVALSTAFLALVVLLLAGFLTLFDARRTASFERILGPEPYGVPLRLYLALWILALTAPVAFFAWHLLVTVHHARKDPHRRDYVGPVGDAFSLYAALRWLLRDAGDTPEVRRSKRLTFCGLLYLIGLAIALSTWMRGRGG